MLIAEEFLVLSLGASGGASIGGDTLDPALAAAMLVELALAGRIAVNGDDQGRRKRARAWVTSSTPTDNRVLDDALAYVSAHEGKSVGDLIDPVFRRPMTKGLRRQLLTRLTREGVLGEQRGRVLGIFPHTTWPTRDSSAEAEIRERVRMALVDGTTATERTIALIALLQATGQVPRVLAGEDKKLVTRRAKDLAEGDWAAKAVKQAIATAAAV